MNGRERFLFGKLYVYAKLQLRDREGLDEDNAELPSEETMMEIEDEVIEHMPEIEQVMKAPTT